MLRTAFRAGLLALVIAGGPGARAGSALEPLRSLGQVDSLTETPDHDMADRAVVLALERAPLRSHNDSLSALSWWTRRIELAPRRIGLVRAEDSLRIEEGRRWTLWATSHADVSVRDQRRALLALSSLEASRAETAAAASRLPLADSLRNLDTGPLAPWDANRWMAAVRIELALGHSTNARAAIDSVLVILESTGSPRVTTALARALRAQIIARSIGDRTALDSLAVAEVGLRGLVKPYSPASISIRISRSNYLMGTARIEESLAELLTIDDDLGASPNPKMLSRAVVLNQIAGRLRRLARLAEARDYALRSLSLMRELLGPDAADVGFSSYILAAIERDLGQLDIARSHHQQAIELMRRGLGARHPNLMETWSTFAALERQRGALEGALAALDSAGAIAETHRASPETRALQDSERAVVLGELGHFTEAVPMALRSARAVAAVRGPENHYVTAMLETAARGLRAQGRLDSACAVLDTVWARRRRQFGPHHPLVAATQRELGFTKALMGAEPEALQLSLAAAAASGNAQRAMLRGLDEQTALATLIAEPWTAMDVALTLLAKGVGRPEDATTAYAIAVEQRSLLTDELLQRRRATGTPAADSLQRIRTSVRATTARLMLVTQPTAPAGAALDSLRRLEHQLDLALAQDHGVAPTLRRPPHPADLAEHSALASFVRYRAIALDDSTAVWGPSGPDAYGVFLVRPGQSGVRFLALGTAEPIDSLAARWQQDCRLASTAQDERRVRRSGHALRERWLDPVLAWAGDVERLHVVLGGTLATVDPAALPAESGGYLIEQRPALVRLSHDADLDRTPLRSRPQFGLLALGGIDYSGAALPLAQPDNVADVLTRWGDCETVRRGEFAALPATRLEAQFAIRLWNRAVADSQRQGLLLTGRDASEHDLRARAPHHAAIHIATHGFQLGEGCGLWAPHSDQLMRTLYRSGLVLAGANRRAVDVDPSNDGLLTAAEVSTLNLEGVRWVTLSACESGLGASMRTQGLIGLERALRIAGANTVVTSLWPVGDESAAAWNASFYRAALEQHADVPSAARAASLERLRALRAARRPTPPRAWDCFVSSGVE